VITDQQVLEALLPGIAYVVSYLLQQEHWKSWINTTIAGSTVLLAGFCTILLTHRLTSDILADVLLVASVSAGLQSGALAPLSQWLKSIGSRPDHD
jgi:uncharacterized membrane protein HdeD (DUF308 family)